MPSLYLPDAISLLLLLFALGLLRQLAMTHVRQELLTIKNELLIFWVGTGLPFDHPAHTGLRRMIDSRIALSGDLSPARQYLVTWLRRSATRGQSALMGGPIGGPRIECFADRKITQKILRFNLEADLSFGSYYLLGSVSGLILLIPVVSRMVVRTFRHRSGSRVDYFFDLTERIFSRAGSRADVLARGSDCLF